MWLKFCPAKLDASDSPLTTREEELESSTGSDVELDDTSPETETPWSGRLRPRIRTLWAMRALPFVGGRCNDPADSAINPDACTWSTTLEED